MQPLPPLRNGRLLLHPERILRAQLRRGIWFVLVQWLGLDPSEATWEQVEDFKLRFLDFQLEDELFIEAGSDVMVGKTYQRRSRG